MIEHINFSDIFGKKLAHYYNTYKTNVGFVRKYTNQDIYLALLKFTNNQCYWNRFNYDPNNGLWGDGISGKYLNEIHNDLSHRNFYKSLYTDMIQTYLTVIDFKTIENLSIDSCFIRNINGINLSRNPAYYNKPGLKIHALVDSLRVPLAFIITDCNVHDSVVVKQLMENMFITKEIFSKYCKTFIADSAYSSFNIIDYITSIGLDIISGKNSQHIKKIKNIAVASDDDLKLYKKRGISENFFSNYLRTPCLINNYEKTIRSYEGLSFFYMSLYIAKKINKIINIQKNKDLQKIVENNQQIKKELQKVRAKQKKEKRKLYYERYKKITQKRKKATEYRRKIINNRILEHIDKKIIKEKYDENLNKYNKMTESVVKRGRKRDTTPEKYQNYINDEICKYLTNYILTKTYHYDFNGKKLYFIMAQAGIFETERMKQELSHINIIYIIQPFINSFFNF
jgi:hypothetical protein